MLGELKPWSDNYRRGNVEAIVTSIERFGFNGALRVWRGVVMAGNHAFLALRSIQEAGGAQPKNIIAQGGDWLVPCIDISHLTEQEARAFAVADNRLQEIGDQDDQALLDLLREIHVGGNDLLIATGFEVDDIEAMAKEIDEGPKKRKVTFEVLDGPGATNECPKCGHKF